MHPRLDQFINTMNNILAAAQGNEALILKQGETALARLVAHDDWLADEHARAHPEFYQQYLLYCCPQERFSVVSFVWGPGQRTPIHDHTVWGLIGMLRGAEDETAYTLDQAGLHLGAKTRLKPGEVAAVSPAIGDIHQVANSHQDQVSISIHVYGADIGKVSRHVFNPDDGTAKTFISGYANRS